jgi:Sulfate permease and related transporters (MFS superfamily)
MGHHVRERVGRNDHRALVLDFQRVPFIDVSAARAVETIAVDAHNAGKRLYSCGIKQEVAKVFEGLGVAEHLPANTYFVTRLEALEAAKEWILEEESQ